MTGVHREGLELLERLGGSGAEIHRAVVRRTGRVVVVKQASWAQPDAAARLGREAAVLRRIQHPSLVRLVDATDDEVGRSIVLAHAPGGSLAARLARHGPLPWTEAADLGARLASALAALHDAGVIHRDVHPGNIVLDAELQPLLIDLEHALDPRTECLPHDLVVIGHPDHLDHRLFTQQAADARTDVHALATTLWQLCTGEAPQRSGPASPVELPTHPAVPTDLQTLLTACLSHRAGPAAAVAAELADIALTPGAMTEVASRSSEEALTARRVVPATSSAARTRRFGPPAPPRAAAGPPPARRRRRSVALAAIAAAIIAGGALLAFSTDDSSDAEGAIAVACSDAGDATATLADLDGDGCPGELQLQDGVLDTGAARFRVGEPGDVLLVGDWDGDGRDGIGLYRPATGAVLLIDDPGPGATSHPAEHHAPGGTPTVVTAPHGDRVEVETP